MVRENPEDSLVKYGDTKCPACGSIDVSIYNVEISGTDAKRTVGDCLTCRHTWSEDCSDGSGE